MSKKSFIRISKLNVFYKHDENNEEHDKVQRNGSDNGNYFKDLINYNNYFGYYFIVNSIEEKNF